jgi:hypothetical protein
MVILWKTRSNERNLCNPLLLRSSLGLKKENRLVELYQLALSFTLILSPIRNTAVEGIVVLQTEKLVKLGNSFSSYL